MLEKFLMFQVPQTILETTPEIEQLLFEKKVFRDEDRVLYFRDFILVPGIDEDDGLGIYLRDHFDSYQWLRDNYLKNAGHSLLNWNDFKLDFKIESDLKIKKRKLISKKKKVAKNEQTGQSGKENVKPRKAVPKFNYKKAAKSRG